jgi:phage FluMu protein Com
MEALYRLLMALRRENPYAGIRSVLYNPITQLRCNSCNTLHTRPHKDGDYVFSPVEEKCPNCGNTSQLIVAIYVEDQTRPKGKR